ncbi:MAG: hypothetical protein MRY64_00500 [Hyphomonadaceae bacterium]|nr:hypothetical protein [Hyphomonadaceae bacterium]
MVMIDAMVAWASEPSTAVMVLGVGVTVLVIQAVRQGREALWGDFFLDECDEE